MTHNFGFKLNNRIKTQKRAPVPKPVPKPVPEPEPVRVPERVPERVNTLTNFEKLFKNHPVKFVPNIKNA